MARALVFLLAALELLAAGCIARPHLYPVCFYQAPPTEERVQGYYYPHLKSVLENAAAASGRTKVSISPDARWMLAYVTKRQDSRISLVWPRVGCIGNSLDSQSTKREADCVAYIRSFVDTHQYFTFGNARDAGGFDIWNESPVPHTLVYCHELKEDEQNH